MRQAKAYRTSKAPSPLQSAGALQILRFDSIDSTNLEAMRHANAGAREGLCIVAREQTAGRGRLDRSWQSPKDAGLYFSIVLRPELKMSSWPLISLMAALAASDALMKACGLRVDIKWPNDRSEEHTSELQSRENLVCRLLLEKKKNRDIKSKNFNSIS